MSKDRRYKILKKLIDGNSISTFSEMLEILPKTVLTHDLGMHHATFDKLKKDLDRFILGDIKVVASLIEVDKLEIVKLIFNENDKVKKGKLKKRPVKRNKINL